MPGIDDSKTFVPLKIAVLTVSDTRSLKDDKSGALLVQRIVAAGDLIHRVWPDDDTRTGVDCGDRRRQRDWRRRRGRHEWHRKLLALRRIWHSLLVILTDRHLDESSS